MILFRADGNEKIGTGHIMRCLSIADAFKCLNEDVAFALADNSLKSLIEDRGYNVFVLNSDYQRLMTELEKMEKLIRSCNPTAIILDSYYVTEQYIKALRSYTKIVYMDDLASFPYPVDVLINYNAYALKTYYDTLYREGCKPLMLLGPSYTPLRRMFTGLPEKKQPASVHNVLVSTGGSDSLHIARNLICHIVESNIYQYKFHFLLGALNKDKNEINSLIRNQSNFILHENIKDMKSLIVSMDLIVSAAGSTLYEICACGVPMITYVLADNQLPGATAFNELGLALNIGDLRTGEDSAMNEVDTCLSSAIIKAIDALSNDYALRCKMGRKMQVMVDGLGADRIALELSRLFNN